MASSILFLRTDHIYAPFEEDVKFLVGIFFIVTAVPPNEIFELSKELLNRVQVRRVRGK